MFRHHHHHHHTLLCCIRRSLIQAGTSRNRITHTHIQTITHIPCSQKSFVWKVSRHRSIYRLILTCLHLFVQSLSLSLAPLCALSFNMLSPHSFSVHSFVLSHATPPCLLLLFLLLLIILHSECARVCVYRQEIFATLSKSVLHLFYFNAPSFCVQISFHGLIFWRWAFTLRLICFYNHILPNMLISLRRARARALALAMCQTVYFSSMGWKYRMLNAFFTICLLYIFIP